MPAATTPTKIPNIHNYLVTSGYQLNFDAMRQLRPRQRYLGVQYGIDIREKLKWAKGESGFGTVLAMEKRLEPIAVLQLLPTDYDGSAWWVALNVPRRKAVYGYANPIYETSYDRPTNVLMNLRKSSFHGPDTDGALFYIRESPGYLMWNPWCTDYWSRDRGSWVFATDDLLPYPRPRYVKASEFVGDVFPEACFVPYPPPETKPKTVNEWDGVGRRDGMQDTRQLALEYLARDCPWCRSTKDIMLAWDNNSGSGAFSFSERLAQAKRYLELQYQGQAYQGPVRDVVPDLPYLTAWYQPGSVTIAGGYASQFYGNIAEPPKKPPAPPPEPEIESKTGRLIILDDD